MSKAQDNSPITCAGCGKEECGADDGNLLQCPTCRELKLPASIFCGQECFTANWQKHKKVHDVCCIPAFPDLAQSTKRFKFTGSLRPGLLSPKRAVPKGIPRPDYAATRDGRSISEEKQYRADKVPVMNSEKELPEMRKMCRHGREILNLAAAAVKPGVTTDEIDRLVHDETIERGLYPSPLNYAGFKKSLCTSVNEVVCHGVPDSRELCAGDIVNLDISAYGGPLLLHTDLNETVFVGKPDSDESIRLVHCAFECMIAGMTTLRPDGLYKHVGDAIQKRSEIEGYDLARSVYSHGVGKFFHSPPDIPHYRGNKAAHTMKAGHVVTIEPMVNVGTWDMKMWPDGWTMATLDGKRSAQFENSCLVTESGTVPGSFLPCEILTSLSAPFLDVPFYMKQLQQWGIEVPKSRLPEVGLPAPVLGGPVVAAAAAAAKSVDEDAG